MATHKEPTIKGVFVNSHLKALVAAKGEAALAGLEKLLGRPLKFHALEDVPVKLELKIVNACFDFMTGAPLEGDSRDFEAGRFHFKDFANTPLGQFILSTFPKDFKSFVLRSDAVANRILKGTEMSALDLGVKKVKLYFSRSPYPVEHLRGFLQEWMNYWGIKGTVTAQKTDGPKSEYTLSWK